MVPDIVENPFTWKRFYSCPENLKLVLGPVSVVLHDSSLLLYLRSSLSSSSIQVILKKRTPSTLLNETMINLPGLPLPKGVSNQKGTRSPVSDPPPLPRTIVPPTVSVTRPEG